MISLLAVVKNEEHNIEKMLNSVQGITREKIIIDTGSTDKTIEICKDYKCKVIEKPQEWRNNLVLENKNFGLQHVTGDWIICLDGDEELSEELRDEMQEFENQVEFDCLRVTRLHFFRQHPPLLDRFVCMFKNNFGYTFQSVYIKKNHEQPFLNDQLGFGNKRTTSNKLYHWAWINMIREQYLEKKERYGEYVQKEIFNILEKQFEKER